MAEAVVKKRMESATRKVLSTEAGPEIDLNQALAGGKKSYLLTVTCDSMLEAGINSGDRIIVDRESKPLNGNIVIAEIDGELLIRRLQIVNGKMQLAPAARLAPILFDYYNAGVIWGVVTYVIQKVK
jgi:DNA polymerase V